LQAQLLVLLACRGRLALEAVQLELALRELHVEGHGGEQRDDDERTK
jgi:hypothetical protein